MEQYPFSADTLLDGVRTMNSFGSRTTGSAGHRAFVDYIRKEIEDMGYVCHSDVRHFERWQAKDWSLVIHGEEGDIPVHVSSPYPYSGETPPEGITSEVVLNHGKYLRFLESAGKIAVIRIADLGNIYSGVAFHRKSSYPEDLRVQTYYKGPVATSFVKTPFFKLAKSVGVKAVICIWSGMSDAMVEGQYLNFILDYQGIPAIWVNESEGQKVIDACKNHRTVTLTLTADRESDATGETLYTVVEGNNREECIIVNTHTDGVNCVEENGGIAMLAMLRYFKENPPERTMVFAFVCGHFRLPHFKKPGAISDQASSLWLYEHPELWNGEAGNMRAVAGLTPEHLGCTEWKDVDGVYQCTGPIDVEMVYTGNAKMDEIYMQSIAGRTKVRTVTLMGHNFLHFGEGQPLFNAGIPEIALVTSPDYLCVESESHEMEKFDPDLMYQQTVSFVKMAQIIDATPTEELGKADKYSFGIKGV